MTTTELYSGYDQGGKPSSRVLRPPGGASSNIFGDPEPAAPKQQVRQEMAQQQQQSPAAAQGQGQSQKNATSDANQEYQRNKPKGRAEAPFAMFTESGKNSAPSQFDKGGAESQNDADFRCYSVTEYRNAVSQNAATRQRAHGQAAGTFNPITHEESQGSSPYKDYDERRVHPQQVNRDREQQQHQQQQQQPTRMVRGQNNYSSGKVQYNPITGEEYPADYGSKEQTGHKTEEQEKDEKEKTDNNESNNTPNDDNNTSKPKTEASSAPAAQSQPAPFQKVRQPPGGKSSGLW